MTSWFFHPGMILVGLLIAALIVLLIVALVKIGKKNKANALTAQPLTVPTAPTDPGSPLGIAAIRYAKGEIKEVEFLKIKENLK